MSVSMVKDANDNWIAVPSIDRNSGFGLLDYCHPIGSLYWSNNPTDPGTLFGGTWTRIKDTFILAAGDNYSAGATGGAATHTLTEAQLPSITGTLNMYGGYGASSGNTGLEIVTGSSGKFSHGKTGSNSSIPIDGTKKGNYQTITYAFGSGQAHNNMPPYKAYYCWERTA